jgi:hypothetical protein
MLTFTIPEKPVGNNTDGRLYLSTNDVSKRIAAQAIAARLFK